LRLTNQPRKQKRKLVLHVAIQRLSNRADQQPFPLTVFYENRRGSPYCDFIKNKNRVLVQNRLRLETQITGSLSPSL
jgi:hypothetical protein